jgi:TolA-binding protein
MKTNWETGTDMIHCVIGIVFAIVLIAGATPGWSQQFYLYAPKPVAGEEKFQKKEGVLVQEIGVKKGDTLFGISRKFSGHGTYYPQILLFNEIKDPNKIYKGDVLRIPVSRSGVKRKATNLLMLADPSSGGDQKQGGVIINKKHDAKLKASSKAITDAKSAKQQPAAVTATSEQRLFERAIKAYRQNDYRTALELFDRFLADYPSSPLAADVSLYKAECYLKQSNQ